MEAQLVETILVRKHGEDSIPVSEITQSFVERFGSEFDRPITNRYVGSLLRRRLHLKTYKSDGVYVLSMKNTEKLQSLCRRYGVDWKATNGQDGFDFDGTAET